MDLERHLNEERRGHHRDRSRHASGLRGGTGQGDTGEKFKDRYGLPDYYEIDLHIAVGWTAIGSIKSARPPLSDMVIRRPPVKTKEGK